MKKSIDTVMLSNAKHLASRVKGCFAALSMTLFMLCSALHGNAQSMINSPIISGTSIPNIRIGGGGSTCPDYDSIGILRTDSATFLIMCCNGIACDTLPVFGSPGGGAIALWRQSGNAIVEVDTNMNVGIGTTAPTVPLEVNGDILFQMPSGAVITSGDDFEVFGVNAGSSQSINFNVSLADSLIGAVVYDNSDSFDYNWQLSSTYGAYIYTTSNDFNAGAGALPNDNASELYVLDNSIDKDISNVRCYSDSSVVLRWGSLGLRDSMRVAAGVITHITPPSITGNSFDKTLTITPFAGSAQKLVTALADGTLDTASVADISPWTGNGTNVYLRDTTDGVAIGNTSAGVYQLKVNGDIKLSGQNSTENYFINIGSEFGAVEIRGYITDTLLGRIAVSPSAVILAHEDVLTNTQSDIILNGNAETITFNGICGFNNVIAINDTTAPAAETATLTNFPVAGDPTGFMNVEIPPGSGVIRKIPYW